MPFSGAGETPIIRNEGFADDPGDDKTLGRLELFVRKWVGVILVASGYTLPESSIITGSSGNNHIGHELELSVNQSGTAGFYAWVLSLTETAVGSGVRYLMDLRIGADSKFAVTDAGAVEAVSNITTIAGEFRALAAGKGLSIKEGTNARMGLSAAMTAGTITISTTAIATGDRIILQHVTPGGTLGHLSYGTIVNATSFVITSSSNTDTSTVFWFILKPL